VLAWLPLAYSSSHVLWCVGIERQGDGQLVLFLRLEVQISMLRILCSSRNC
jgi:hypothetical protein